MNIKEYLKTQITIGNKPNLEMIYQDLMNLDYSATEICQEINTLIIGNINKTIEDYQKRKDE